MNLRRIAALAAAVALALAGTYALAPGVFGVGGYDRTTVTVEEPAASTTAAGGTDAGATTAATATADGRSTTAAGGTAPPTVAARDANGSTLATVRVRVADTYPKRYTGLSETESLAPGHGMLFVHPNEGTHAYVMREMDFPIDIVFVAANGTITRIHHAELPPEDADDLTEYPGYGKYVLEVPYGYTNETGIDVGDTLVVGDDY